MSIKLLELLTAEEGQPRLRRSEIELRSSGNDMVGDQARMSAQFDVRHTVFVEFPVGFKRSARIPDRVQIAVVLTGQLQITANGEESETIGPGAVFRVPKAENSEHTLEVVGAESVSLMVVIQ